MDFASDLKIFQKFSKLLPVIFFENDKKEPTKEKSVE